MKSRPARKPNTTKPRDKKFGERSSARPGRTFSKGPALEKRGEGRPSRMGERGPRTGRDDEFRDFLVWGRHPVSAFLKRVAGDKQLDRKNYSVHIIVEKSGDIPQQLTSIAKDAEVLGIRVFKHRSEEEGWPLGVKEDLTHQRVCMRVPHYPTEDVSSAIRAAKDAKQNGFKGCVGIVLDQIHDPRNFGAILRSAAFFGAKFVAFGKNRQAEFSPLVVRTSAGGAFQVNIIPVVNISRTLEDLKEAGAWIVGTSVQNATPLDKIPVDRPFVLVVGNEQKGQRPEVTKHCDYLTSIPGGSPMVDSLNVSVAAGVLIHHFSQNAT